MVSSGAFNIFGDLRHSTMKIQNRIFLNKLSNENNFGLYTKTQLL